MEPCEVVIEAEGRSCPTEESIVPEEEGRGRGWWVIDRTETFLTLLEMLMLTEICYSVTKQTTRLWVILLTSKCDQSSLNLLEPSVNVVWNNVVVVCNNEVQSVRHIPFTKPTMHTLIRWRILLHMSSGLWCICRNQFSSFPYNNYYPRDHPSRSHASLPAPLSATSSPTHELSSQPIKKNFTRTISCPRLQSIQSPEDDTTETQTSSDSHPHHSSSLMWHSLSQFLKNWQLMPYASPDPLTLP